MQIHRLTFSEGPSSFLQIELLRALKPHTSPVVTTAVDESGSLLATGSSDGSVKVWDLKRGYATHTFHGHGGVISALCFFQLSGSDKGVSFANLENSGSSTVGFRLASGSEDGKIRIWDLHKRKGIASLDSHVSVVRSLSFSISENALLSASRDKTLIVWDARTWKTRRIIPVFESVEATGFLSDNSLCYTGGENGRLRIWDLNRGSEITRDQEAASEQDSIVSISYSANLPFIMTVHVDQTLRLHSVENLLTLNTATKIEPLPIVRRISGNDDEVIDLACVGLKRSLLALATNTEYIRIINTLSTGIEGVEDHGNNYFGADVAHLEGHDDIIICIDTDWSGHWLATGAKDNTARLWRLDPASSSYTCYATFTGHAESLGAIALSKTLPPVGSAAFNEPLEHPPAFVLTGSQDRTIKRWNTTKLSGVLVPTPHSPKAVFTRKAHEKDINALDVNHSSTLFASASQDRTAKIWSAEDGSIMGILRGHRRGVWSIKFAPKNIPTISSESGSSSNRGLVITGSGDKTVKVWSLSDYSCLLTFEGHTNSVLKVLWLPPPHIFASDEDVSSRGAVQINPLVASAGADGLVKIWSPYSQELETTLDNHTDRVWALATPFQQGQLPDSKQSTGQPLEYSLISGGADSVVTFWRDTTSTALSAAVTANSARIEQDQKLQNYIRAGAYREAITLALQLNHPGRLLSLFTSALDTPEQNSKSESLTGNADINAVIKTLDNDSLYLLLLRIRDWNTNAKTAPVAQRILYALSKSYPPSTFIELAKKPHKTESTMGRRKGSPPAGLKEIIDALIAYTERHYRRVEELVDESYLVEWVLSEMDGGIGGAFNDDVQREKDVVMLGT